MEITDTYTYLGLIFTPSGSVTSAAKELLTKASRAYFSMSNILYENKTMKIDHSLQLFNSLICPIAQYASEFWSILSIPLKSFNSKHDLMKAWEVFIPETLNQRFCRLIMSVHKKTSRLALLGELGHYPLLVQSFIQTLKYKWSLTSSSHDQNSLVCDALTEMSGFADSGLDCWLTRVRKLEKFFNIPHQPSYVKPEAVSSICKKRVKSVFDRFWLDEVNQVKIVNGLNSNKLRFYSTLKSSFTREPYLDLVQSRNQRSFLTRLRCSAHRLEIEKLRYTTPPTPPSARVCGFCCSGEVGDEEHFIMRCSVFAIKRACFMGKMSSINPNFETMSYENKLKIILCPKSSPEVKTVNKFIRIMCLARDNLSEGQNFHDLTYPTMPVNLNASFIDYDNFSDVDEWEESNCEISDTSFE